MIEIPENISLRNVTMKSLKKREIINLLDVVALIIKSKNAHDLEALVCRMIKWHEEERLKFLDDEWEYFTMLLSAFKRSHEERETAIRMARNLRTYATFAHGNESQKRFELHAITQSEQILRRAKGK